MSRGRACGRARSRRRGDRARASMVPSASTYARRGGGSSRSLACGGPKRRPLAIISTKVARRQQAEGRPPAAGHGREADPPRRSRGSSRGRRPDARPARRARGRARRRRPARAGGSAAATASASSQTRPVPTDREREQRVVSFAEQRQRGAADPRAQAFVRSSRRTPASSAARARAFAAARPASATSPARRCDDARRASGLPLRRATSRPPRVDERSAAPPRPPRQPVAGVEQDDRRGRIETSVARRSTQPVDPVSGAAEQRRVRGRARRAGRVRRRGRPSGRAAVKRVDQRQRDVERDDERRRRRGRASSRGSSACPPPGRRGASARAHAATSPIAGGAAAVDDLVEVARELGGTSCERRRRAISPLVSVACCGIASARASRISPARKRRRNARSNAPSRSAWSASRSSPRGSSPATRGARPASSTCSLPARRASRNATKAAAPATAAAMISPSTGSPPGSGRAIAS